MVYRCRSSHSSMLFRFICMSKNCCSCRMYSTLLRRIMPLLGLACAAARAGLSAFTGASSAAKLANDDMFRHESFGMPLSSSPPKLGGAGSGSLPGTERQVPKHERFCATLTAVSGPKVHEPLFPPCVEVLRK